MQISTTPKRKKEVQNAGDTDNESKRKRKNKSSGTRGRRQTNSKRSIRDTLFKREIII